MPPEPCVSLCCALHLQLAAEEGDASSDGDSQDEGAEGEGPDLDAVLAQEQAELDW